MYFQNLGWKVNVRSNRTFMELKLGLMKSGLSGEWSSNRTFMELK